MLSGDSQPLSADSVVTRVVVQKTKLAEGGVCPAAAFAPVRDGHRKRNLGTTAHWTHGEIEAAGEGVLCIQGSGEQVERLPSPGN